MNLVLHPATALLLTAIEKEPPQSLLLSGASGTGLLTIASGMAAKTRTIVVRPQTAKGEVGAGGIGVEAIRDLYDHTRTKTVHPRTVIIDDADKMSPSAQASFLKLLEEPNESTRFILTTHTPSSLLPTIRSRVQSFHVQSLTDEQSKDFIRELGVSDATKQTQLLFLAAGLPAELTRLIQDDEYFQLRASIISDARNLIAADTYQKLRIVHSYRLKRDEALRLIDSAMAILRFSLRNKPQPNLVLQLEALLEARERLLANQNVALQLARAVL
jgi:DNA polymerase III delta prime subunit